MKWQPSAGSAKGHPSGDRNLRRQHQSPGHPAKQPLVAVSGPQFRSAARSGEPREFLRSVCMKLPGNFQSALGGSGDVLRLCSLQFVVKSKRTAFAITGALA